MSVWDWINSATDFVKHNTPDVTQVTEVCRKGYGAGWEATNQIDVAVRTKTRELHEYFSDDQVRSNAARIATNFTKNSALYLARCYGAGPVIDVVTRSRQDSKADSQEERIQELETKVAQLEKELKCSKNTGPSTGAEVKHAI